MISPTTPDLLETHPRNTVNDITQTSSDQLSSGQGSPDWENCSTSIPKQLGQEKKKECFKNANWSVLLTIKTPENESYKSFIVNHKGLWVWLPSWTQHHPGISYYAPCPHSPAFDLLDFLHVLHSTVSLLRKPGYWFLTSSLSTHLLSIVPPSWSFILNDAFSASLWSLYSRLQKMYLPFPYTVLTSGFGTASAPSPPETFYSQIK